ncbi:hypothetical protein WCX49_03075 [Sulfurimonas sp. HSL-1656]|uniref:hypothetical protein n=1 Tax=Thiomicrolovo subterrani TaxID=3131934 RepID=UPI0031F9BE21
MFVIMLFFAYCQQTLLIDQNDDLTVWNLLVDGEYRTLIVSNPLSAALSFLYHILPAVPWYSLTLMLPFIYSYRLSLDIADRFRTKALRFAMRSFLLLFFIIFSMNLSVTMITVLLFVINLQNLQRNVPLFWIVTAVALLLRTDVVLGLSPLAFLTMMYLYMQKEFVWIQKAQVFAFFPMIVYCIHIALIWMDPEYARWLSFNNARAYFVDFQGMKGQVLSELQHWVIGVWWVVDEDILPTEQIIAAAGNMWMVLYARLMHFTLPAFLQLYLLTGILMVFYSRQRTKNIFFLLMITSYLLLLVNLRDVERVVLPVTLFAIIFLFYFIDESTLKSRLVSLAFLSLLILFLIPKAYQEFKESRLVSERQKNYYTELAVLTKGNQSRIAIPVFFPVFFLNLNEVFKYHRVFDEGAWPHWGRANYYVAGWLSRHPYFYRKHNISHGGIDRRFDSYYEFMMDENTTFLGGNATNIDIEQTHRRLLDYYDHHKANMGCKHKIVDMNSTLNFKLVRLSVECQ